jgi:hypothetical protein
MEVQKSYESGKGGGGQPGIKKDIWLGCGVEIRKFNVLY